jgi:hypothetical protein
MKPWTALFFVTLTAGAALAAANALSAALNLTTHHAHWIGFLAGLVGFCGGVLLLLKYEGV